MLKIRFLFVINLQIQGNMLINFSIQNFGSIKEKQTLSFEADKSSHLVIPTNGLRLLKLALIYGANASGKTTILNALEFLINVVLNPKIQKTQPLNFEPFLFDKNTLKKNTIFNIDFIQNNTRYLYKIELNKKCVVKEVLSYAKNPVSIKKATNIFERTTDFEKQLTNIAFNSKIKIDNVSSKTLVANALSNNTVLGGFSKTNIDLKELTDVTNWFEEYLNPVISINTDLYSFITRKLDESEIKRYHY
jgi:AAA15 family ATPase/GTPase